jgi:Thioredoxin-like domain
MSENAVMADTMAVKMNSVVLIRQFADENEVVVYEGDEDSLDQLKSWFNLYGYPLLMPLTEENKSVMFDAKRPGFSTHFIAVLDSRTIESKSHIKFLRSLAVSHAGKCLFILVDLADPNYAVDTLKDLGVDPSVYPTAVIVASRKEAVHVRKFDGQAFDAFHVEEWINIFFTEKLSKTTNSVHKREL